MTAHQKISDENAEYIGTPILDKVIQSLVNNDREEFIQHFPYLNDWMTVEIFDEAVEVLSRLGEIRSRKYSTHTIKNDKHLLAWNVNYTNDTKKVVWELFLSDHQEGIKLAGFRFDR